MSGREEAIRYRMVAVLAVAKLSLQRSNFQAWRRGGSFL